MTDNFGSFILLAAGKNRRIGGSTPKPMILLHGKPLFIHILEKVIADTFFKKIYLVIDYSLLNDYKTALQLIYSTKIEIIAGDDTRFKSFQAALKKVDNFNDEHFIFTHDAARPFITNDMLNKLKEACHANTAIAPVIEIADLLRDQVTLQPLKPKAIAMQTPQIIPARWIKEYNIAEVAELWVIRDEISLAQYLKLHFKLIEGWPQNVKITFPHDLQLLD